ncbi:DUF2779 domain-containing protein [Polynucleobacter paneuropaeus]|nr:DUF2779 domain-containing protein [Polynucleobacter paneuropaeus]
MSYLLTKTKVMTGLQCPKKLWFDVNDPIRKDSHLFHIGNRFGDFARTHYGPGLNLAGDLNATSAINKTNEALANPLTSVIYEAALLHSDTLVRPDVLIKKGSSWEMVEIKASTSLKDEHVRDATIQTYILESCGLKIDSIKIGHINNEFIYKGKSNYSGLLVEVDVTEAVNHNLPNVQTWIDQLKHLGIKGAEEPQISIGEHCSSPYICNYIDRCESLLPKLAEVPISIIPYAGKKLAREWASKEIYDLRDLPTEALKNPIHQIIQKSHIENMAWIDPSISKRIQAYEWPRFFMDFETVQQGVPLVLDTKPYQAVPFQWSVHRWDSPVQKLRIEDGVGFLEFYMPDMEREFLKSLINVVGNTGPIFVHNASFEKTILNSLASREDCADLKPQVELMIKRIVDTLDIVRQGFYAPEMKGSYSLKSIVKAIPTKVDYLNDDSLSGGGEAQIAWFKCTDAVTLEAEKQIWSEKLKKYCAQDTFAMYDLLKYLTK